MIGYLLRHLNWRRYVGTIYFVDSGAVFPLRSNLIITALDELYIELPFQLIGEHEVIGSVIRASKGCRIHIPVQDNENIEVWMLPGQTLSIAKNAQVIFWAPEKNQRSTCRIRFVLPKQQAVS